MKKKSRPVYEPHLVVRRISISPGSEWQPQPNGWSVIRIADGGGYCMSGSKTLALETGSVLLLSGSSTRIRASQLGKMSLDYFTVIPSRLTGLITLGEQQMLAAAPNHSESVFRILAPGHPVSEKMRKLGESLQDGKLMSRLKLLELFVESLGSDLLAPVAVAPETGDARERLQVFLHETPPHELAEMEFSDLARNMRCTSRHLTRVFRELVGMSFSDKRAEIRMERARELLATGKSKVVDVALESGYKSLSLFNLMFARRFGTSPGRWRRKYAVTQNSEN